MPSAPDNAPFGEADLRHAAGDKSYGRGLEYLDAVRNLEIGAEQITATVHGTDAYEVVLILDGDGVTGECSCPHGQDGFFCKHLVAVGLTALRQGEDLPQQRAAAEAKAQALDSWLDGLSRADLLTLVREQVRADRDLRRRLELRAAAADPGDMQARVQELLDVDEVSPRGYLEYSDAKAYSTQIDQVVDVIDGLTGGGQAATAVSMARYALQVVTDALERADDSDGYIGDSARELAAAHAQACATADVDQVELASWLAGFVLGEGNWLTNFGVEDYGEALGDQGKAEYRLLITEVWQRNPTGWHEKVLMQGALQAIGDVDALVAMYAADLGPHGLTHLMIAQELDRAGRAAEALHWAERGLREATDGVGDQLVDYLVARYESVGAPGKAVAARQTAFDKGRTLARYRALRDAAGKAGQWQAVRERALRQLQKDAAGYRAQGQSGFVYGWTAGPVWVSALIDDGDIAAAWDAAAGIASARQWLTLADLIVQERPGDALPVYLRAVEPLMSQTGDPVYEQVAGLLVKIRDCHQRLGTSAQFTAYLTWLRADQKRKRNLIKLLDRRGLRTAAV
jgi:hypothetical protein